ncbi:MAG: DUF2330 domain-containing protein [Tepidisphaerales bacterium]
MRTPFILAVLFLAPLALADGIMFSKVEPITGRPQATVDTPRQNVAFYVDGREITVVLSTHLAAGPADVAWLVPVPAEPRNVEPADTDFFTTLDAQTAPQFFQAHGYRSHYGCGCASEPDTETVGPPPGVVVHSSGTAGSYAYKVISAPNTSVLTMWVTDNQYYLPPTAVPLLDMYVGRGYYWLAIRLRPDARAAGPVAAHPFRYTYTADRLRFPLIISRMNTSGENEVVVHVIGDKSYAPVNFREEQLNTRRMELDASSPSGTSYERILRSAGPAFFVEFCAYVAMSSAQPGRSIAPPVPGVNNERARVTRLHAVLSAAQMTQDLELAPTDPRIIGRDFTLPPSSFRSKAAVPFVGLLLCSRLLPRKSRRWRLASSGLLTGSLLVLACV